MEADVPRDVDCLLKPAEVARILNVSKALVYRLIRQGFLPAVRIGHAVRVRRVDLDAYIEECRSIAAAE